MADSKLRKQPDKAAVSADHSGYEAALAKVLASEEFSRAPRLSALLKFVSEETLAGRGKRLKAFVIAQAVFGRDESFDATNDTIVRVEAGRLRRALERFYLTEGANNSLQLRIPKGAYEVSFNRVAVQSAGKEADSTPFLAVLPLETGSEDAQDRRFARGLVEALITNLTQYPQLSVMAHSSVLDLSGAQADLDRLRELGATHALTGYLDSDGRRIQLTQHLIALDNGAIVWSLQREGIIDDALALQQELALEVVRGLAGQIVPSAEQMRLGTENPAVLARFREGMLSMSPPTEAERMITARNIFTRLTQSDPEYPGGHAGLAFILAVGAGLPELGKRKDLLATSEAAAHKCLSLDPDFGFGHTAFAVYLALTGQHERACREAALALELGRGDAMTLFGAGFAYQRANRPELAIAPMEEALRLDPIEPRTPYMNTLAIVYLTCGAPERSIELFEKSRARGGPEPASFDLFLATAYVLTGNETAASLCVERLPKPMPGAEGTVQYALPDKHQAVLKTLQRLGLVV